jgi:ABC-type nitrate/sulfonate/bicarbonate transport system permease component
MTVSAGTAGTTPGLTLARFRLSRVRALQLLGLALFLIAWQIGGSQARFLYSTPLLVAEDMVELFAEDEAVFLILASLSSLLIGMLIGIVIGVLVGTMLGRYRWFGVMFEPYFAALYSVPRVAFVPLMVVWFGIRRDFVIASVVAAVSILVVFATAAGVRETMRAYGEISTSLRVTGGQFFRKVLLPGSVPFIATGVRLAVQRGITAVIVAEFLVGVKPEGIGQMLRVARVEALVDRMFSTALVALLVGVVLFAATGWLERRFSRWRPLVF